MSEAVLAPDPASGVEIWRGGVNTWECDEMGHMNVRFYVARAMEGLAGLALRLGLPEAFSTAATATVMVREHHIRFLKEAHAGAPLHMTGGLVSLGEDTALILQVLIHTRTGEPCATFLTHIAHVSREGRAFAWPARTRAAAETLKVEIPPFATPRSISADPITPTASMARADEIGLGCAGRGCVRAQEVDAFGRMAPEQFIGRVSDGVSGLLAPVRKAVLDALSVQPKRIGGAVLEYRLIYLDWPHVGDHVELRSGLQGFDDKTQRMNHWLLDPVSGRAWGTSEAVAVNLDLDAPQDHSHPARGARRACELHYQRTGLLAHFGPDGRSGDGGVIVRHRPVGHRRCSNAAPEQPSVLHDSRLLFEVQAIPDEGDGIPVRRKAATISARRRHLYPTRQRPKRAGLELLDVGQFVDEPALRQDVLGGEVGSQRGEHHPAPKHEGEPAHGCAGKNTNAFDTQSGAEHFSRQRRLARRQPPQFHSRSSGCSTAPSASASRTLAEPGFNGVCWLSCAAHPVRVMISKVAGMRPSGRPNRWA